MLMNGVEETSFSLSREAPLPDRRRQPRHITILRVGTVIIAGRRELCLIRNISAGGLKAHIYSQVKPGDPIEVELKTNQRVAGRVSWAEGNNAGIAFNEPVEVEELLAPNAEMQNGWRPRLPRVEVDRLGTLRLGSHVYALNTRDISQGGVKIEIDERLDIGAEVVVTLEKFRPMPGTVRWYQDGFGGIAFNQLIPFQELIAWLRRD